MLSAESSNYTTPCQSPLTLSNDATTIDFSFEKDHCPTSMPALNGFHNCGPCFSSKESSSHCRCSSVAMFCCPDNVLRNSSDGEHLAVLVTKLNEMQAEWVNLIGVERQVRTIGMELTAIRERVDVTMNDVRNQVQHLIYRRMEKCARDAFTQTETRSVPSESSETPDSTSTLVPSKASLVRTVKSISQHQMVPRKKLLQDQNKRYVRQEQQQQQQQQQEKKKNGSVDVEKLVRLQAIIRGHFVRELFVSDKVQNIVKTIRETIGLLEQYDNEPKVNIEECDVLFHSSLCAQMEKSIQEFHTIFFHCGKAEQLKIIQRSKEAVLEKSMRETNRTKEIKIKRQSPHKKQRAEAPKVSKVESKVLKKPARLSNVKTAKEDLTRPSKVTKPELRGRNRKSVPNPL